MSNDRYKELMAPMLWKYNNDSVSIYIPEPTEFNYRNGFITRYFIRRTNDPASVVYEIDTSSYSKYKNNPFFLAIDVVWRISGAPIDKIKEYNRASIDFARQSINNIHLYLVDTSQFYKNVDF